MITACWASKHQIQNIENMSSEMKNHAEIIESNNNLENFLKTIKSEFSTALRRWLQTFAACKAALWAQGKIVIVNSLLEILCRNVLHDDFIRDIARASSKVSASPQMTAPELFCQPSVFGKQLP